MLLSGDGSQARMIRDYYSILQISPLASQAEVKVAYRKQSKINHPDVNKSINANETMQLINEAFFILSNVEKRRAYDVEYSNYMIWKSKQRGSHTGSSERSHQRPFTSDDYSIRNDLLGKWIKEARKASREIVLQTKSESKEMMKDAGIKMGKVFLVGLALNLVFLLIWASVR